MMSNVRLQRQKQASRPILAYFDKVASTFPKTSFVIYYRNHIYEEEEIFKNLDGLRELFLPNQELQLKIINFEKEEQPIIIKNSTWQIKNNSILIGFKYLEFSVLLSGSILNKSQSNQGLINLSLSQKKGYDNFYKYRKKYKTLQNITKKIDFHIDHRIKVVISGKEYQFDLEDKKKEHYFLNLVGSFDQAIMVVLEETTSIEDFIQVEKVEEVEIEMNVLGEGSHSYSAKVTFGQNFEISLLFNLIKNENFCSADFVAVRVLQTSTKATNVKIGTEDTINLNTCIKIQPLINNKFFDFQWGYLNENLSKIQGNSSIYQYIDKITKSVPKYAHFMNQQVIDLKSSNFIILDIDGVRIKVPIVYILKGFNHVQNQKISLKFYIDSSRLQFKTVLREKSDKKRVYELGLMQIWNLNKLNRVLDANNSDNFAVKIINEDTYYFIPFQRRIVNRSEFRKESKELLMKNQVTQRTDNKFYSIQNSSKNKDQLILIQSTAILPFYLIKITSSSSLSVQVIIGNSIVMEGSLTKEKILSNESKPLIHLLTSVQGNSKVGIIFNFTEIQKQNNDSANTYYNFRHRLYFAEAGETEEVTYDIQIEFEKDSKLRSLKSKLSPQVKRQTNDGVLLREFTGNSGVFRKEETLNFTINLRKMYFNQELNFFDNEVLMTKEVSINPTAAILKANKATMVRLEKECYEGIQFDLYDLNVKKRMKYYLQIYAEKSQFLDYKDSSYKIKIPSLLWNFNNLYKENNTTYTISTHLNRKNKNTDSKSFPQNFGQEIVLDHYNYNDGVSLVKAGGSMAYSKFLKAIKQKCDVLKDKLGWNPQSQWYFAVLSLANENFYFLVQRMFDPYEDKKNNQSSNESRKTVSRQKSNRSDMHKIDPLAKTISNLDLFKLKQKKNQLIAQGRQLTARYVKRQQKIVELTKKLSELDEKMRLREQEQADMKADKKKVKKQNVKMKEFYRSICECGARNPQFNGYCDACLKILKQKYETYTKQYNERCYEYEKIIFDKFNKKEKIEKLKKKILNMKNQNVVVEVEDNGTDLLIKDMQEKSLKKTIEDLKVEIFDIQEEKSSLISTSNWQMSILQEKIANEDERIYKASQQYDSLKNKYAELLKITKKTEEVKISDL